MLSQFLIAILFYFVFSLFSIIGLPFVLRFRTKNTFVSYLIAKPLGLVIFAYPVWILSYTHIIKFNNQPVLLGLFFFALIVAGYFIYTFYRGKKINFKKVLLKFLIVEVSSIALFCIYLYFRGFNSAIEGTERFMDMHLYMSAGKTDYYPFKDIWWPSKTVNYYYYGFYLFALITRLANISYSFGYNFCLGLILTQTAVISYGIVYKTIRSVFFAIFGSALVTFAGNLHYTKCLIDNVGKDLMSVCYYPNATRIINPVSYTINEMPSYSFVLGDMHPHVMGIPFLLMNLYLILIFYRLKKINRVLLFCLGIGLATSAMINTWDFMALAVVLGFITLHKMVKYFLEMKKQKANSKKRTFYSSQLIQVLVLASVSIVVSLVLFMPFFLKFKSPVEGIGFSPSFVTFPYNQGKDFQYPSSFGFLFGLWGIYVLFSIASIAILFLKQYKFSKFSYPTYLVIVGVLLIIFTELFYFKDLFHVTNPQYFRANTVFKLGYIAWIFFSIGMASLLGSVWKNLGSIKNFALGIFLDLIFIVLIFGYAIAVFIYPYYAVYQAYRPSFTPWNLGTRKFTLDGNEYIKYRQYPEDLGVIKWLNENQKERIVLVEAVGGSYTYHARIGVNTGMMNPINWPTHEWTWRFQYPSGIKSWKEMLGKNYDTGYNDIAKAISDVKVIYESLDLEQTKELLNKYDVKYVYISPLERETYTMLNEEKFSKLGSVVYSSETGMSKLYKLNNK